jgi:hypothetical protein
MLKILSDIFYFVARLLIILLIEISECPVVAQSFLTNECNHNSRPACSNFIFVHIPPYSLAGSELTTHKACLHEKCF